MSFRPILFVIILLCYACQPLAEESLFVGMPTSASEEIVPLVDGTGERARFEAIRQLERDSLGNLYVSDRGAEHLKNREPGEFSVSVSIRRITPEGNVTTLIGRGIGRDLIEFQNFVIRDDVLYTASAGCLLKANLRQPVIEFEVFYGKCLSLAELNDLIQKTEDRGFPTLVKEAFWRAPFERIQPDNEIYLTAGGIPSGQVRDFKITPQEDIVDVTQPGSILFPHQSLMMDTRGWIYRITQPDASPFPNKLSFLERVKFTRPFGSTPHSETLHEDQLEAPTTPVLDSADYLYVFDRSLVKMIKPDGSIQSIASIFKDLEDNEKKGIAGAVVNPQRTFLYFATATAVYRIPLPDFKGEGL